MRVKQQIFKDIRKNKRLQYIKSIKGDETEAFLEINLNRYFGRKIKSLTEFNSILKLMLSDLEIDEYYISRLDIALDTEEYENCYKVNSFIVNLDSVRLMEDNAFNNNHKSGAKRQYILKSRNYQHTFYDKKAESKGYDDACSRTEIRYIKNINDNNITAELAVNETIHNISKMMKEFDTTIIETVNNLYDLYIKETSKDYIEAVSTFSEFIIRHTDLIKTKKIFTELYKRCMSGSCASWLNKFRKSKSIELPLKSDIQSRLKEYKEALKYYKNN